MTRESMKNSQRFVPTRVKIISITQRCGGQVPASTFKGKAAQARYQTWSCALRVLASRTYVHALLVHIVARMEKDCERSKFREERSAVSLLHSTPRLRQPSLSYVQARISVDVRCTINTANTRSLELTTVRKLGKTAVRPPLSPHWRRCGALPAQPEKEGEVSSSGCCSMLWKGAPLWKVGCASHDSTLQKDSCMIAQSRLCHSAPHGTTILLQSRKFRDACELISRAAQTRDSRFETTNHGQHLNPPSSVFGAINR